MAPIHCPSSSLTLGIKHVTQFAERRTSFVALVTSIREQYSCPILVSIDGDHSYPSAWMKSRDVREVTKRDTFLSKGRNDIVAEATTQYVMIMDDDVLFTARTNLTELLRLLVVNDTDVVTGCYELCPGEGCVDCYSSTILHPTRNRVAFAPCDASFCHAGQNLLMFRRRFLTPDLLWDVRAKMMEHETFFIKLYYAGARVRVARHVRAAHAAKRSHAYEYKSMRRREHELLPYVCHNFPRVSHFQFPFAEVDCRNRRVCLLPPGWPRNCRAMQIAVHDDSSTHRYVLDQDPVLFVGLPVDTSSVSLRARMRRTWGTFDWKTSAWEYAFFVGGDDHDDHDAKGAAAEYDRMYGDIVRVRAPDRYDRLTLKCFAMFRWIHEHTSAAYTLKADTDSFVHVDRLVEYLDYNPVDYGGDVSRSAQIIRSWMRPAHLSHPMWYPSDFGKWAVDDAILANDTAWPDYAKGGGYVLSSSFARRLLRAEAAGTLTIVPHVEDVTVGLAARQLGVPCRSIRGFYEISPRDRHRRPPRSCRGGHEMKLFHRVDPSDCVANLKGYYWQHEPRKSPFISDRTIVWQQE